MKAIIAWSVVLLGMIGITAGQTANEIPDGAKKHSLVFDQSFPWNDELGSGSYVWGDGHFLKMDGSIGKIQCSRLFKQRIQNSESSIELGATFALGKKYRLVLFDSSNRVVLQALIGRDDRVLLNDGTTTTDSGAYIGSVKNPQARPLNEAQVWHEASVLHTFGFDQFDFETNKAVFVFDGKRIPNIPINSEARNIDRLEIATDIVEPGEIIWVDHFSQTTQNKTIDDERFDHNWTPVAEVKSGYPSDKWRATTYRPKDYQGLQVCTQYGAVYCKFSDTPIPKGNVELEMMSSDVDNEVQLTLGKYKYEALGSGGDLPADSDGMAMIAGGWHFYVGTFARVWTPFLDVIPNPHPEILTPFETFKSFDKAPPAEVGKVYKLKMEWDTIAGSYRVWIDDALQTYNGSPYIHTPHAAIDGIDMITIHPGNRNPWVGSYLYSRWGHIKITAEQ